jgi:hypothetical protein
MGFLRGLPWIRGSQEVSKVVVTTEEFFREPMGLPAGHPRVAGHFLPETPVGFRSESVIARAWSVPSLVVMGLCTAEALRCC